MSLQRVLMIHVKQRKHVLTQQKVNKNMHYCLVLNQCKSRDTCDFITHFFFFLFLFQGDRLFGNCVTSFAKPFFHPLSN